MCREHFTSNDFDGPTSLRVDAVPSLFTTHSRSLMDKQNSSPNKRFRPDLANIRAKQTMTNNKQQQQQQQQRPMQLPYRNSNHYQRQQEPMPESSPIQENFEENNKQINYDIDLSMNCSEEQLSETQTKHCPVKVSGVFLCNQAQMFYSLGS